MSRLITPLAKAKGLGAAHDGAHHWWMQRVSAIALVPLSIWLLASLLSLIGSPEYELAEWLQNPVQAVLLVLFLMAMYFHAFLGLKVVLEDYIPNHFCQSVAIILVKLSAWILAVASIFSVIKMHLSAF